MFKSQVSKSHIVIAFRCVVVHGFNSQLEGCELDHIVPSLGKIPDACLLMNDL